MAFLNVYFFSEVLGKQVQMNVILPQRSRGQIGLDSISEKAETYPTLYLLHGMSDDHTIWERRTSIERYASEKGIAVVMPDGDLSWYTDMKHGQNYFTFMADELPAVCRDFFPKMSPRREDTFVAGLSMGGYGAFKLGSTTGRSRDSRSLSRATMTPSLSAVTTTFSPWLRGS